MTDLEACWVKCCSFLFHSEVKFLCIHRSQLSDSGLFGASCLERGLDTDFHLGLIQLNAGVLSRMHFRLTVNDGLKRKALKCMSLNTGNIVDIRIESLTTHPHLYKQPSSSSVKALTRKTENLQSKYIFASADKAANNVIFI